MANKEVLMSSFESLERGCSSNPSTRYNYNAYGAAESQRVQNDPLENYIEDRELFFNRHWDWALAQATEMFKPIAEKLGERNVRFSSQNDKLIVSDLNLVSDKCSEIVKSNRNNDYFGCTKQNDWYGNLFEPYKKPGSTTYLAQEWAAEYVKNAFNHELSHQALVSVRQMPQKDHQRRRRSAKISLSDETYNAFMRKFDEYDALLDEMDKARLDARTQKIVIDKKSDIWPLLKAIVDVYCQIIKEGMN